MLEYWWLVKKDKLQIDQLAIGLAAVLESVGITKLTGGEK